MKAKLIAITLIALGEALAIVAESVAAKRATLGLLDAMAMSFALMLPASLLLLAGYATGFSAFRRIWPVTCASVLSILIVEPIVNLSLFRETPSRGAIVGIACGLVGLFATLAD